MTPEIRAAVLALSADEKLDLIGELWDDIATAEEARPVPDWLKEELDRRKAYLDAHPESALTWDEVVRSIKARHARQPVTGTAGEG